MRISDKSPKYKFTSAGNYECLRNLLRKIHYTDKGVMDVLGLDNTTSINQDNVPHLLYLTRKPTPLNTLIRLFLIEAECKTELVQQALHPFDLETLQQAGLIAVNGSMTRAAVKLLPYRGMLVAFDLVSSLRSDLASHYVMGVGRSTMTLENLAIMKEGGDMLDLGTGCGILSLLAAGQYREVTAVDLNPRAVQVADFNAKLNGFSNINCLEGDLFSPVQGKRFDLILSNPPFVISPENRYIYRDGGMSADSITRKIIEQAPQHLNEGGFCQILCNWAGIRGEDWQVRLKSWFAESDCDAWVMCAETRDVATYASTWIKHTELAAPEEYAQRFDNWLRYYEKNAIEQISAGTIFMRKSSNKKNWFITDPAPDRMLGNCGEDIVRRFETQDFLESLSDDDILNQKLKLTAGIRLERVSSPDNGMWKDELMRISRVRGFAYSGNIDSFIANMMVRCDGKTPLRILMQEVAASLSVEKENIAPDFCRIAEDLLKKGFLVHYN